MKPPSEKDKRRAQMARRVRKAQEERRQLEQHRKGFIWTSRRMLKVAEAIRDQLEN